MDRTCPICGRVMKRRDVDERWWHRTIFRCRSGHYTVDSAGGTRHERVGDLVVTFLPSDTGRETGRKRRRVLDEITRMQDPWHHLWWQVRYRARTAVRWLRRRKEA